MRPMLLAPNPSLAFLLSRPPSRSELQVVSETLPSVGSMTRVGVSSIAASSGSLTGIAARCLSGSLDLSEESMIRVGSAGSTVPSDCYPSGSLGLSEESMTRVGSAGSTVPADRVTLGLACLLRKLVLLRLVLRCIATCSLSLGSWLRSTATRKLVQRDDLSSSNLGIGHLVENV